MTAGSRSSPAMVSAGSPGRSCWSEKMITDTKNSVGTSWSRRWARKVSMAANSVIGRPDRPFPRPPRRHPAGQAHGSGRKTSSLQLHADHANEAIRHRPIAFEPCRMRDQQSSMEEVEDAPLVEDLARDLGIECLAVVELAGQASAIEPAVHILVAIAADVLRRLA